jgi:hypothetical protein
MRLDAKCYRHRKDNPDIAHGGYDIYRSRSVVKGNERRLLLEQAVEAYKAI